MIPADITGEEMDRGTYKDIVNGLGPRGPEAARRIVAAVRAVDEGDYEAAGQHADIARRLGTRLALVREAVGLVCYEIGEYDVALKDLRAAQRMSGVVDLLPVIADCERAGGRPQRALDLAASPEATALDMAGRVEMVIVAAGARGDLGQHAAAVETLRLPALTSRSEAAWQERIWYAFGDILVKNGQPEPALNWFDKAAGHPAGTTDAAARAAALRATTAGVDDTRDAVGAFVDLEDAEDTERIEDTRDVEVTTGEVDPSPVGFDGADQDA